MVISESRKRANNKHRKKLSQLIFYFNKENQRDAEALEKFSYLSMKFKSKKETFLHMIENEKE